MSNEQETKLWQDYQNGLAYQSACGIAASIPRAVRFFEGDQWPAATEKTRNMPRPVFNIVRFICRNKKAAILSTPVRIIYKGEREDADLDRWNRFSWFIQKEIGQEELDKRAIEDAVKKGTYVYHYYWDAEAKGLDALHRGGLRCEIIDPLHVFFADPTQKDEQKQAWILIASREPVASVKAKADKDVDPAMIGPDSDTENKYGTPEQDESKLCTVLTRYFRKDGEIYIEKATKSVVVNKPFPLAPDVEGALRSIEEAQGGKKDAQDAPNNTTPDDADTGEDALTGENVRAPLYPIVVGSYETRENSIFGIGEADGLIPNQKIVNFLIAMSVLNVQEVAWGKYIVLPGALGAQKINNDPGQVLIDHSGTGTGIKKMAEQGLQTFPVSLVDTIMSMTRTVAGSTEVMTGETIGANMSGSAIAALQSQAQQPIEDLRNAFWQVKVKQGRVLAQFYKLFYEGAEFAYADEMRQNEEAFGEVFNGSEYDGREYDVAVEVTGTAKSSIASDIAALDTLLAKGAITPAAYIKAYPDEVLSNKQSLIESVEGEEQNQIAMLTQQMQALQAQLTAAQEKINADAQTISQAEAVAQKVDRLERLLIEQQSQEAASQRSTMMMNAIENAEKIRAEGTEKINQANAEIERLGGAYTEANDDARLFAEELARRDPSMLMVGE